MRDSSEQFPEILAHILARSNRALSSGDQVPPMYFALSPSGEMELGVGVLKEGLELSDLLNTFQDTLKEKARSASIVACGITYANYSEGCIVALLENMENYCATYKIPVTQTDQGLAVDAGEIVEESGSVYVFTS